MLVNIPIANLHADPRNANYCTPETQAKILKHIQRSGKCPYLIVRPHPTLPDHYIIIDGHHRLLILKQLGWGSIECQVWEINDEEAGLALSTINRLRGTDDFHKRAELIESLTQSFGLETLAELLPESEAEIKDMLALLRIDEESLEREIKAIRQTEEESLPVPFTFMVPKLDAPIVETTLKQYESIGDRGAALVAICKAHKTEDHSNG